MIGHKSNIYLKLETLFYTTRGEGATIQAEVITLKVKVRYILL